VKSERGQRRVMCSPTNNIFEALTLLEEVSSTAQTALLGAYRRPRVKISHQKSLRKKVGQVCPNQATIKAFNPREIRGWEI